MTDISGNRLIFVSLLLVLVSTQCVGTLPVENASSAPFPVLNCAQDAVESEESCSMGQEKVFFVENTILSMIDLDGRNLIRIAENVTRFEPSPDNRYLVYRSEDGQTFLYAICSQEVTEVETAASFLGPGRYGGLAWTPDSKCLFFADRENARLGLYHLSDGRVEEWPHPWAGSLRGLVAISPDGSYIATTCTLSAPDWCLITVGGTETHETDTKDARLHLQWSPDGRYVLYYDSEHLGALGLPDTLYYVDREAGWARSKLLQFDPTETSFGVGDFEWSLDGARVVAEVGTGVVGNEIAVIDFPQGTYSELALSSLSTAREPSWGPDGESIVFVGARYGPEHEYYTGIYTVNVNGNSLRLVKETEGSLVQVTGMEAPMWLRIP